MKKIGILFFALVLLLPAVSWAGEYVLEKGQGVEVCETYKKDLERLNVPDSMMCQIWFDLCHNPAFLSLCATSTLDNTKYKFSDDFTRLIWKRLDPKKNKKLVRSFLIYRGGSLYDNDRLVDEAIRGMKRTEDSGEEADLYTASIDLDSDGKKENVLLYRDGFCPTKRAFSADIYILNKGRSMIDANHPIQKLIEKEIERGDANPNRAVHVFQYKNNPYIGKYCGDLGSEFRENVEFWKKKGKTVDIESYSRRGCREDNTLSVYSISKGAMEEVCKYQYKNNENK